MKPRHNPFVINSIAIAAALALGSVTSAFAVSATWNGTTDAVWATGTNWSATPVPGTGDTATFNNAGGAVDVINLGAGVTIGNLIFDTSSVAAYTIGSGAVGSQTLTLNNAGAITANSTINANQLFNANLVLGTDATAQSYSITNNDTSNRLTFAGGITGGTTGTAGAKTLNISAATGGITLSGAISNGGATSMALAKTGAGILTLTGSNSHSGTTTISGGNSATVKLLVSGTGALTGGGALQVGSASSAGRFEYTSSAITTQFSTITLGSGSNGGTGTLIQSNGTITATTLRTAPGRTAGNTGNIDISAGTLRVTGTATIGEQDLAATPSTVTVSGTGLFQVDNGLRVGIAQSDTRDGNGIITQNGGTVTVAGGLTLAGTAAATMTRTAIYNLNGGTLNVNAITMATTGAGTNTSTFNFAGGTLKPTASSTTFMQGLTTANVRNGGAKIDTDGKDITIAQSLVKFAGSTTDTLTKSGVGTLTLSGTNTYTGGTTVNGGSLVISGNSSSANGAVSVDAGSLYVSGQLGGNVTVAGGATIGSGIDVSVGAGVLGGTLTLNGTSTLDLTNFNGIADLSALSISFASTGFGVDNLTLGGAAINWDSVTNGTYTLLAGTLISSNLDNFGYANRVAVGSLGREAYFQNGSLQLVVIPEPSAALLGGLGMLALLRRRRA